MNNLKESVLTRDLSNVDKDLEQWMLKREKKQTIYIAIEEYILFLKNSLENENRLVERIETEQEIKQLEKEKQKYYVPSILAESCLTKVHEPTKTSLENSSFKLIKKINDRFKK